MHQSLRADDGAAINLDERLMPEADAENRYPAGEGADHVLRHPGLGWDTGPRGDAQVRRLNLESCLDRDLVVPVHAHVCTEHKKGLHQVVGERIVVVDQEEPRLGPRVALTPPGLTAAASGSCGR